MIVLRCASCENEIEITEPLSSQTIACCKCGQLLIKSSGMMPRPSQVDLATLGDTQVLPAEKSNSDTESNMLPPGKSQKNKADSIATVDLDQFKKLVEDAKETPPDTGCDLGPMDDALRAGPGCDLKKQMSAESEQIVASLLEPAISPEEMGWLGPYRVLKLLGRGGMGMVFLAEDSRLKRPVALKVMLPHLSQDSTVRQRFLREARATANIRDEHIVTIHEVGLINDIPYLAAEFLQGQTLEDWLTRGTQPAPNQILDLALQIARGLKAAHKAGVIHRDIKPANIWLETRDEGDRTHVDKGPADSTVILQPSAVHVKILDFGLAHTDEGDLALTKIGAVLGTPAYMAPEQSDGRPIDARSDLFSLGCVLYELSAGFRPFDGVSAVALLKAIVLSEPRPLQEVNRALPRKFCDLVMKLLSKKPDDRPASAGEVVGVLEAVIAERRAQKPGSAAAPSDTPAADCGCNNRRSYFAYAAGLAAVLVLGTAVWLLGPLFRTVPSASARGVTSTEVVLGLSAPFSGSAQEVGRELEVGLKTYFEDINAQGGVAGRKIRLVPLDDGYEPDQALANMQTLFEKHKVFGFIGNAGTPTAMKTLPYALDKHLLFFGAYSGAPVLRKDPPDRFVFNVRASYEEETAAIVQYLVKMRKVQPEQIALFAQHDDYGDAGERGVKKMLRAYRIDDSKLLRVGYERGRFDVDDVARKIVQRPDVRAVVMMATYRPAGRFIQKVKDAGRDLIFASVSFVGGNALADDLNQRGPQYADGVIVTQVVPNPDSEAVSIAKYRTLLARYYPNEKPDFVSLEGYLDAMVLVEGMKKAGNNLTTDTLIDALESLKGFDPGIGVVLGFGPSEHQASHKVWGTVIDKAGKFQTLDLD